METQPKPTNGQAVAIIDAFDGTTALAELISAPVSTVQSWKYIGIPKSRMAHLELLAASKGLALPVVQT